MKKFLNFTIGGLRDKIMALVLLIFISTTVCFLIVSGYKTKYLAEVVGSAREEQVTALRDVSTETMDEVLDVSMTKTNALQAYIADDMFEEIRTDVMTLQSLATEIMEHRNSISPNTVDPPRAYLDGTITAQALAEEGVDYRDSDILPVLGNMTDTMIAMCNNSTYMDNCYIGLSDGTSICIDGRSGNKFDGDGNVIPFPARIRPWYIDAAESGELCFSGVIRDTFSGESCVTCSAPVYWHGDLVGVVGIDLFLDAMEDYVAQSSTQGGFICIINSDGQMVFAPEGNGIFSISGVEDAEDLRQSANTELASFVNTALSESTGLCTINIDGKDYYMCGSPITSIGWAAVSVVDKEIVQLSTAQMLSEYDQINDQARAEYKNVELYLSFITGVLVMLILIVGITAVLIMSKKIVEPIESMTDDIIVGANTGKLFEMKPIYNTQDEIEVLAKSFDDLSKKTKQYIDDITQITKENERISTELTLATQIQAAMLPHIFPPYPDRHEFDIYAMMDPAREVGGDFYDFFFIDDDHLCLVMADVSGKGIPAALFMMISKTILQSCAMLGKSPAEILTKTNEALCYNNQVEMFVTVWLGILEISTGKLTASNAGHEYPVIIHAGGEVELFKEKHGLALGAMEESQYKEYELQINRGDKLFLYTDGIPEATDADDNMFRVERMLDALKSVADKDPKSILDGVKSAVADFVKDAEQFDDLTMLCLTYSGK